MFLSVSFLDVTLTRTGTVFSSLYSEDQVQSLVILGGFLSLCDTDSHTWVCMTLLMGSMPIKLIVYDQFLIPQSLPQLLPKWGQHFYAKEVISTAKRQSMKICANHISDELIPKIYKEFRQSIGQKISGLKVGKGPEWHFSKDSI